MRAIILPMFTATLPDGGEVVHVVGIDLSLPRPCFIIIRQNEDGSVRPDLASVVTGVEFETPAAERSDG